MTIGIGAVTAANSFVREDVEPYAIVSGTPARVIKYRFEPKIIERLLGSKWWNFLPHEMADIRFDDENIENVLDQLEELKQKKLKEAEEKAVAAASDEALLDMLTGALIAIDIPKGLADMVLKTSASSNSGFEPDDQADQQIFRNKLVPLSELVNSSKDIGAKELKQARNLFS